MRSFFKVWLGISLIAIGIGIGLLVIAFGTGITWEDAWGESVDFTTVSESYEGVRNIDIDISAGEVKIIRGDTFSITADHIIEDEMNTYVENGTWYISEDDRFTKYGIFSFPSNWFIGWNKHISPKITITIPEGFSAGKLDVNIGAGVLTADSLKAEDGLLHVDAGKIKVDQLKISGKSECSVDTGEIVLQNVVLKNVRANCDVGSLHIDGEITGDNDITCGVGNVDLDLIGDYEDFNYNINCDIGNVKIDGKSYSGIDNQSVENNNSDNMLDLNCDIGHIDVEFN